jgi:hypothetical protein
VQISPTFENHVQKKLSTLPNNTVKMSPKNEADGVIFSLALIIGDSFSSTKLGRKRT